MMDNQGNQFQGIVCEVTNDAVIMDFNHPMAGKELNSPLLLWRCALLQR